MSISTQPNEMLEMILNQTGIPLRQRLRLRAVSPRFRATLEEGMQQDNSLAIRIVGLCDIKELKGDNSNVQPYDLIINVSSFTAKKAIAFILRLFPRLTELAINSNSLIAWRNAADLLGHFARTLTSLKVDGRLQNYPTRDSVFPRLAESINSMHNLSSLCLELESAFKLRFDPNFGYHLLPHLAPTLSRLERFTFARPIRQELATFIATSLSPRCTHLHLNFYYSFKVTFPFRDAFNLTHLYLDYSENDTLQFVIKLPRLTTLTLNILRWQYLDTLLKGFRPLSWALTQLTLLGIPCDRPLERPASKAATFPSISGLTLQLKYISSSFNPMDYLSTVALWFPKLTTCALHVHEDFHEEILAIQQSDLPFAVKLIDKLEATF